MKILVTGAGTLIGNEICKFLLKKNIQFMHHTDTHILKIWIIQN